MKRWPAKSRADTTTFGGLTRGELMSRVRSSGNVTTELRLISLMRAARLGGWRRKWRLLGNPDFVFLKAKVAIFVDGCFWHGHNCRRNLTPRKNVIAWRNKIEGNRRRDRYNRRDLRKRGWKVLIIWECTLTKTPTNIVRRIERALHTPRNTIP